MNKNTKYVFAVVGVGIVLGFLVGYFAFSQGSSTAKFGSANVTPGNALNQQSLVNELNLIANPLVAIANGTTAAIDFPSLATSTLTQSTTTVVTNVAGALGDQVLVSPVIPTSGATFSGYVSTASTTSATVTIVEGLSAYAAVDATSTTFNVIVLPSASFKAPTGL